MVRLYGDGQGPQQQWLYTCMRLANRKSPGAYATVGRRRMWLIYSDAPGCVTAGGGRASRYGMMGSGAGRYCSGFHHVAL